MTRLLFQEKSFHAKCFVKDLTAYSESLSVNLWLSSGDLHVLDCWNYMLQHLAPSAFFSIIDPAIMWEAGDPGQLSYKELVRKLKARYGATGQKELFVAQLRSRRRRPNETLAELYPDIKRLMALAYPYTSGTELHEEIAKA
jgi:hypothetical protein